MLQVEVYNRSRVGLAQVDIRSNEFRAVLAQRIGSIPYALVVIVSSRSEALPGDQSYDVFSGQWERRDATLTIFPWGQLVSGGKPAHV